MSLDDIWNEPIASPSKPIQVDGHSSPLKRPRQSLFLSDSDSDYERPPKRALPAPAPAPRSDVEALFEDLDKDGNGDEDEDLSYKPLAPALDLAKLAKEAEAKHANGKQGASSQAFPGGSTQGGAGGKGKDQSGKGDGQGEGEKKGRKPLPKLDEERLIGADGFPQLIKDIKGFKISGKGNEHQDLTRLMQVYQFWSHKMYPKTSFKDNVGRVEKLCHSKRMQVRLSVWRDEFKGVNGKKPEDEDDPDIIDLTEPTVVETAAGDGGDNEDPQWKSDRASSQAPSLPPASSEAGDDDDFDIEAAIKAEEERLAMLRGTSQTSAGSKTLVSSVPNPPAESSRRDNSDPNAMDVDEESYWAAFDDPQLPLDPPQSTTPSSAQLDDDDDMWAIVNEIEQGEQRQTKPTKNQIQIPLSGVNIVPSSETASIASGDVSRATNDDDWDEMYS